MGANFLKEEAVKAVNLNVYGDTKIYMRDDKLRIERNKKVLEGILAKHREGYE